MQYTGASFSSDFSARFSRVMGLLRRQKAPQGLLSRSDAYVITDCVDAVERRLFSVIGHGDASASELSRKLHEDDPRIAFAAALVALVAHRRAGRPGGRAAAVNPGLGLVATCSIALAMPILMVGLVNRTKSLWAGRKGPTPAAVGSGTCCDCCASARSTASVATPLFRAGAWVVLASSLLAAHDRTRSSAASHRCSSSHDFIVFAYTLGLARLFLMLSAMDVGSSFEGMGAAREASFSAFVEPALFLLIGAASVATGSTSFAGADRPVFTRPSPSRGWCCQPSSCSSCCCRPRPRGCRWTTR